MLSVDLIIFSKGHLVSGLLILIVVLSVLLRMLIPNLTTKITLGPRSIEYSCNTDKVKFLYEDIQTITWDKTKGERKSIIEISFKGGGISFNPCSFKNIEQCVETIRQKAPDVKVKVVEREL